MKVKLPPHSPGGGTFIQQLNTQFSHLFMNPISLRAPVPAPQSSPSFLVFQARLLLAEKSSATPESTPTKTETIEIRATTVATIQKRIPSYRHYGINE
jgi:hypothetical protein